MVRLLKCYFETKFYQKVDQTFYFFITNEMTTNVFRDGIPSSRMMLLKSFGDPAHGGGGFVFFTNYKVVLRIFDHKVILHIFDYKVILVFYSFLATH